MESCNAAENKKRPWIEGYTPIPNVFFVDPNLRPVDRNIFMLIQSYQFTMEYPDPMRFSPGYIQERLNLAKNTVKTSLRKLLKLKYLRVLLPHTKDEGPVYTTNLRFKMVIEKIDDDAPKDPQKKEKGSKIDQVGGSKIDQVRGSKIDQVGGQKLTPIKESLNKYINKYKKEEVDADASIKRNEEEVNEDKEKRPLNGNDKKSFGPNELAALWNEKYAHILGRGSCHQLSSQRLKKVNSALKVFPKKEQWEAIFNQIVQQPWTNDRKFPFSFDSIFEKDRFLKAFEQTSETEGQLIRPPGISDWEWYLMVDPDNLLEIANSWEDLPEAGSQC